jgi:homoserine kinase
MKTGIKVFAPASVANVAVGFDVLGFALEKPGDEIIGRVVDTPGVHIAEITGGKLPKEAEKNTAGFAVLKMLEHLGEKNVGIEMRIHKKMPFGSGLGSSAASAAAAVFLVNELLKKPLTKRELLPFAILGESIASGSIHADNVAPSLLGGLMLVRDAQSNDVHRVHVPRGMYAAVVYPHVEVLTKEARAILRGEVEFKKVIRQTANIGAFIIGMFNGDFELIKRSLHDELIEPQRAQLIPHFYEVQAAALSEAGVLGCSISGSGPSIFALTQSSLAAEKAGEAMRKVYEKHKIKCDVYLSPINQEGAILC